LDISPFTQPEEAVLPNVFLKQFQIQQRICFTSTATTEADTATTTAVPNAPLDGPKGVGSGQPAACLVGSRFIIKGIRIGNRILDLLPLLAIRVLLHFCIPWCANADCYGPSASIALHRVAVHDINGSRCGSVIYYELF
jgi:hypothetical protein